MDVTWRFRERVAIGGEAAASKSFVHANRCAHAGAGDRIAIFSVTNAVLLRNLPVHDPKDLVLLKFRDNRTERETPETRKHPLASQSLSGCELSAGLYPI